ncbi:MAG: outer membrane protein transport protein [Phascolarctobacterium sp.]|nr:outer membrane protein transport protein [Phascolarctobacterium sp.]
MKKHLLALSAAAVLLAPQTVGAEGFSINEWSAEGFAMGGARMFAENDAANMAYNPASLTKIKGEVAKISATYISPHGKYKTEGGFSDYLPNSGHNRVHPAWVPGTYYVKQMNEKEWIGVGAYARFGNSCQFQQGSMPGFNNTSAKVNGMSMGVNYARKLDSKWSASLGAEVNYAWLQMDKTFPYGVNDSMMQGPLAGLTPSGKAQVEGESYALGWNVAANYAFDDKNEVGIVYRSAVNHSMEANVRTTDFFTQYLNGSTEAYGCVTLPESVMIGYGHKFNDKTRVELNGTWTRWSRFDSLDMKYNKVPTVHPDAKNWKDGWRYAIGIEHKLSDKYSLLGGVAYDESAIPDYYGPGSVEGADFMIPTGTRTTFTIGTQYHDEKQTVAFTLGYMKVGDLAIEGASPAYTKAKMYDSYTKLFSLSYQYHF